ncbi:MAG: VanZ family protein [Gammaproteobacteria bacterium]|nr:VanZ family protein [Gammaproteobacteria bacterium]
MEIEMAQEENWFSVAHLQWARVWLLIGMLLITSIFYLSLTSRQLPIPHFRHVDKALHFAAYGFLMGWFVQIFHNFKGRLVIGLGFIAMGVTIEFLQALHPMRHFDVLDMLANMTGVTLALLAGFTWLDSILVWFEKSWLHLSQNSR